jgi:two-component system, LytTR family, sensor kinase
MILQPLVENAIRHGASRVPGPASVRVSAHSNEGTLHLTVTDDGPGLRASPSERGTGLSNVRERLDTLYGSAATLTLGSAANGRGVTADISMPLLSAAAEAHVPAGAA